MEDVPFLLPWEAQTPANTAAKLLRGTLVVQDIERWCHQKAHEDGVEPAMAVVFFNTGPDAVDYVEIKAHVAARAGVGYCVYEMSPDASTAEVMAQVQKLNAHPQVHGILIQRPFPEQIDEPKIMASISHFKHIEEYSKGEVNNVAADAIIRLLSRYGIHRAAHHAKIQVAGCGNIITDGFNAHMKRHFPYVDISTSLPNTQKPEHEKEDGRAVDDQSAPRQVILISELHRGPGFIKPSMVSQEVRVIVDLGFYATEKGIIGDLSYSVFDKDDLTIAPTPGGVLPILLWVMMERTIKSKQMLVRGEGGSFCACQ